MGIDEKDGTAIPGTHRDHREGTDSAREKTLGPRRSEPESLPGTIEPNADHDGGIDPGPAAT